MNSQRHKRIKELFLVACELEQDRVAAFLDKACADDPQLRQEVESLLKHHLPTTLIGESPGDTNSWKIPRFVPKSLAAADDAKETSGPPKHNKQERFPPGTMIAGRYRILGLLGRGGMGEVYRADDLKLDQTVALKFLSRSWEHDDRRLAQFHNEVRLARKVTHPNVNRVYDIGECGGETFISMEYVDGQDLGALLRCVGRLSADKAMQIAWQLCAGLGAAHDQGVLHLDLKPANIMIDGTGQVRITDFGIAALAAEVSGEGPLVGTPAFMAPELFRGKTPTVRADLYSLGVVLYESVTGLAPPMGFSPDGQPDGQDAAPLSLPADVDPALQRVILQCLERDPWRRPDSAHEIAAALPGVDPLDAVLAAGETPSPDMVAAAGAGVGFRPKLAVACLTTALLGLMTVVLLANRTLFLPQAGLSKSPDVLAHKAQEIISLLGQDSVERGSVEHDPVKRDSVRRGNIQGFAIDRAYLQDATDGEYRHDRWENLSTGRPPAVFFWYRQGDDRLLPPAPFGEAALRRKLPAEPGMNTARLDCKGRLIKFEAIPLRAGYPSASHEPLDWSLPFTLAGLDITKFAAIDPIRKPSMYADRVVAWEGVYPENPSLPIRIEAASLGQDIVSFNVIPPYHNQIEPADGPIGGPTSGNEAADGIGWVSTTAARAFVVHFALHMAAMACGVILAYYNLSRRRCDRRGAGRLALFVFVLGLLDWIVGERHSAVLAEEAASCYLGMARITLAAAGAWLWYIALEPYVRRWWPQTLITWSRMLQGHFRDPLLGRDILIGGLFGICMVLLLQFDTLLPAWLQLPEPAPKLPAAGYDLAELLGVRYKLGTVISVLLTSIIFGLAAGFLMSLFRVVLQIPSLAALAFCLLLTTVLSIDSGYDTFFPWLTNAVLALGIVLLLTRVGLVAVILGHFVSSLILANPITSDLSAWYSAASNFTVTLVAMLLIYGFYLSLPGRRSRPLGKHW